MAQLDEGRILHTRLRSSRSHGIVLAARTLHSSDRPRVASAIGAAGVDQATSRVRRLTGKVQEGPNGCRAKQWRWPAAPSPWGPYKYPRFRDFPAALLHVSVIVGALFPSS